MPKERRHSWKRDWTTSMVRPHSATGQIFEQSRNYAMISRKWDMKKRSLSLCFPIACQLVCKALCLTSRRIKSWVTWNMLQFPRWYLTWAQFNRRVMQNITIRLRPSTTKHSTSSFTDRPLSTNNNVILISNSRRFSCLTFRRSSSGQIRWTNIQWHSLFSVRYCPSLYLKHLN